MCGWAEICIWAGMKTRALCFGVSLTLLLACGAEPQPEAAADLQATGLPEGAIDVVPRTAEPPAPPEQAPRKLIKTGSLSLRVEDVDAAATRLKAAVDSLGGYVANERGEDYGTARRYLTLRIPAPAFGATVARAEAVAAEVLHRQISVEDKTAEYVDVDARLTTQRVLATRLRELVTRTGEVKDLIEVERELARVTGEIERYEARLRTIDRDAAYATLEVSLEGAPEEAAVAGFGADLAESLGYGWAGVKGTLLVAVALWPLWLLLTAVGFAVWRWRGRRRLSVV